MHRPKGHNTLVLAKMVVMMVVYWSILVVVVPVDAVPRLSFAVDVRRLDVAIAVPK